MPMHPCLRLSNLNGLPASTRRVATAAANGSPQDLERLLHLIPPNRSPQSLALLPVFYTILDPEFIPTGDCLAPDLPETRIRLVISVLRESIQVESPEGAGPDYWPRYWLWFHWIYTSRSRLAPIDVPSDTALCFDFLFFTCTFFDHGETRNIISTTENFFVVLFRFWKHLITLDDVDTRDFGLLGIMRWMVGITYLDNRILDEMFEGAGGDINDLTCMFVDHIQLIAPSREAAISLNNVRVLRGMFTLINALDTAASDKQGERTGMTLFFEPLLTCNAVRYIMTAMCSLSAPPIRSDPDLTFALDSGFSLLRMMLNHRYGQLVLFPALVHGLLPTIISCAQNPFLRDIQSHLEFLMTESLAPSLIDHSIVTRVSAALAEVEASTSTDQFKNSSIFGDWSDFAALAAERALLLDDFDSAKIPSMKACDNMKCGKIGGKSAFKRCSKCRSVYYCSSECQADDWTEGGHKTECPGYTLLALSAIQRYSTKERAFMRAVLHHHFENLKLDIYRDQIGCLAANPGIDCFVLFDFTGPALDVSVQPFLSTSEDYDILVTAGAEWHDAAARARRSGGRMALHLMRVREGEEARYLMVPLRTNNSIVHDGLRRIAAQIPSGAGGDLPDQLDTELERLLSDPEGAIVEIY